MRKIHKLSITFITVMVIYSLICPAAAFAEETSPTETPYPTSTPIPKPTPTPVRSNGLDDIQSQLNDIYDKLNNQSNYTPDTAEPTEKPIASPLIKVLSPQTVSVSAGRLTDVTLTLKNVGISHAYSVLTQAKASGDSAFSISFLDNSNSNIIVTENNQVYVVMRLMVDKTAKPGTYNIDITNSFRDMYGVNLTQTDSITVKVENPNFGTGLILKDFNISSDKITPGDTFTLNVTLSNISPFEATGVNINIEGMEPGGINMTGTSGVFRSSFPAGNGETISYKFTAAKKAVPASYPLTFTIKYKDPTGEEQSQAYTYYVNVVSKGNVEESGTANVEITSLEGPADVYKPGQIFSVRMGITNTSSAAAKNIKVTVDGGEAIKPMSANIKLINALAAGDSTDIQFSFSADESAKSQTYMIHFTLSFETGNTVEDDAATVNETVTVEQYAGINIYNPPIPTETPVPSPTPESPDDPKKINKPKMIISDYKTDPPIVSAGKEFTLNLDFQNTHKTKTVSNLKIVLSAKESTSGTGNVFSPVDSGNTLYFSEIPPQGIVSKTLKMMAAPDAQPRSYSISVKFDYQDEEFLEYEEEEDIGINVKQVTRMEISDLGLPPDGLVGQQLSLYCNIINSGRVALNNLRVRVESEGMDTAGASVYLGKLSDGSSTYYEGTMTPINPGAIKGKLIVSGEDDAGAVTEISRDFEVQVQDFSMEQTMLDYENIDMFPEQPASTGFFGGIKSFVLSNWIWISVGAGLLIIITLVIVSIVKRHRKQRSWEKDE